MRTVPKRFIAVDWSGDKTAPGQRKKIWIADWDDGEIALTNGRTRDATAEYVIAAANKTSNLVAGFDFAFAYPAWFVREQGCKTAEEFWDLVARGKGEEWLTQRNEFCWGGKGTRCPGDHRAPDWRGFRRTDRAVNVKGTQPKSPFQIGGAGAVGTGSLRGIPHLVELKSAGFSIWPFDLPKLPMALEIYPRIFTGDVTTSRYSARAEHLSRPPYDALSESIRTKALDSEDAFDALCSVIGMKDHAKEFTELQQATNASELLEGQIWQPSASSTDASS